VDLAGVLVLLLLVFIDRVRRPKLVKSLAAATGAAGGAGDPLLGGADVGEEVSACITKALL
jgi:hypothetical protein